MSHTIKMMSKREISENNKENDVYNLKSDVKSRILQIYDMTL